MDSGLLASLGPGMTDGGAYDRARSCNRRRIGDCTRRIRARPGLSHAPDPRAHRDQRRRHQRHFPAPHRRPDAKALGPAADRREPARRRHECRRARLLRGAKRRLHHLHAAGGDARLQQIPVQEARLRCRKGFRADHQSVFQHPGAGGQFQARREDARRTGRAVEGEARYAELRSAVGAARAVHGEVEGEDRRRPRARAVSGRRRGGQRRHRRLDAGCVLRPRQLDFLSASRQRERPGDGRRAALAAVPRHPDARRARLSRQSHARLFRHRRANGRAAADRSQAARRVRPHRQRPGRFARSA